MGDGRSDRIEDPEAAAAGAELDHQEDELELEEPKKWKTWIDVADVAGATGVVLLTYGAWKIYDPAGWILSGLVLTLYAIGKSKAKGP